MSIEDRIIRVLKGEVLLDTESRAIQSACQLPIYEGAVAILKIKTKEGRNRALLKIPEAVRPYVKAEVLRIWEIRNEVLSDAEHTD